MFADSTLRRHRANIGNIEGKVMVGCVTTIFVATRSAKGRQISGEGEL